MQTFLPYADFKRSAEVLDYRRLGKQRVETWQLIRAINGETRGWRNHPAAVMWRDHVPALAAYGATMCNEWIRRGYNDSMLQRFEVIVSRSLEEELELPPWLGNKNFHLSHQSNLVRKFPEHYRLHWPEISEDLPYIWPRNKNILAA
jgi:hypothetical protein